MNWLGHVVVGALTVMPAMDCREGLKHFSLPPANPIVRRLVMPPRNYRSRYPSLGLSPNGETPEARLQRAHHLFEEFFGPTSFDADQKEAILKTHAIPMPFDRTQRLKMMKALREKIRILHGAREDGSLLFTEAQRRVLIANNVCGMSGYDAFLNEIGSNPKEDGIRLLYADYIEEMGEYDRAEFIRIQIALSRETFPRDQKKLEAREKVLSQRHGKKWLEEELGQSGIPASLFPQGADHFKFRRGFLSEVSVIPEFFEQNGADLFSKIKTLDTLSFGWLNDGGYNRILNAINENPIFNRIASLEISSCTNLEPDAIRRIASTRNLSNLIRLKLHDVNVGVRGMEALGGPNLAKLTELTVSSSQINDDGIVAFSKTPHLNKLRKLDLASNSISEVGAIALAKADFPKLSDLNLNLNQISSSGAIALAGSQRLKALTRLSLNGNKIDDDGIHALSNSPTLAKLSHLYLNTNTFSREGVRSLANSSYLRNLELLSLSGVQMPPEAMVALAASPILSTVKDLNLSFNWTGVRGAEALAASPHLGNIEVFAFGYNAMEDEGAMALAKSKTLSPIEVILDSNSIGDLGARALADSPFLHRAENLSIIINLFRWRAARYFVRARNLQQLQVLKLSSARENFDYLYGQSLEQEVRDRARARNPN